MTDASALRKYAERHGLTYETGRAFTTGSLVRFRHASDHSLSGTLPGGLEGTVALMTYTGEGDASHETLCLAEVRESIAFCPKLYCRDSHFKHTRSYTMGSEGFASDWRGTEFESEAVNRTWAVQVTPDQDDGWLRELFAPTFLDWLGQHSPEDFTFELLEGQLTCRVDGEVDDEAGLDRLIELTTHIAERIRIESLEEERAPAPFSAPLPPPKPTTEREATDRAVAKREWDEPPKDMATAISGYRGIARREPGGWKAPLLLGGGIGGLILAIGVLVSLISSLSDFGAVAGGSTAVMFALIAIALGGFLFWAARRSQVQKRARRYGQRAFVVEYARSRDLEHEDPRAFHARFLRVGLPGPARNVMFGRHPATQRETRVLLCTDQSGQSAGFEVAVVPAPDGAAPSEPAASGDGALVLVEDGHVVASRPTARDVGPSVDGLDAVARRVAEAADRAVATSSSS